MNTIKICGLILGLGISAFSYADLTREASSAKQESKPESKVEKKPKGKSEDCFDCSVGKDMSPESKGVDLAMDVKPDTPKISLEDIHGVIDVLCETSQSFADFKRKMVSMDIHNSYQHYFKDFHCSPDEKYHFLAHLIDNYTAGAQYLMDLLTDLERLVGKENMHEYLNIQDSEGSTLLDIVDFYKEDETGANLSMLRGIENVFIEYGAVRGRELVGK